MPLFSWLYYLLHILLAALFSLYFITLSLINKAVLYAVVIPFLKVN